MMVPDRQYLIWENGLGKLLYQPYANGLGLWIHQTWAESDTEWASTGDKPYLVGSAKRAMRISNRRIRQELRNDWRPWSK